jgi:RimJ/RimL family protein N-acetyltransferase
VDLLRTERLTLRSWEAADAQVFFDIYSRWSVMRWLGPPPRRVYENLEQAARGIEAWRGREHPPLGLWAIVPAGEQAPVGTVLLLPLSDAAGPTDEVEVGWHLHPDREGEGWATDSARALLSRAALPRVLALTDPDNTRSQAVCTRLGMTDEGLTDRWFGTTMRQYAA